MGFLMRRATEAARGLLPHPAGLASSSARSPHPFPRAQPPVQPFPDLPASHFFRPCPSRGHLPLWSSHGSLTPVGSAQPSFLWNPALTPS